MQKNILKFYLNTSSFTYLGEYKNIVDKLPNDIKEICYLIRMQTIHPIAFSNPQIRISSDCFWGNMQEIKDYNAIRQDDNFPTAISMIGELLRINPQISKDRLAKEKLIVTCRGVAILLAAILKGKGIPARVRSGFANYPSKDGIYWDHWIVEYYNDNTQKWTLIDADCCCNDISDFDIFDIPHDKFISAPKIWKEYREKKFDINTLGHAYYGKGETNINETLLTAIFYDFHCLMNNEIIYMHFPKYLRDKNFILDDEELKEIDELATLMLDVEKNFGALRNVWENNPKFRILTGGTISYQK